MACAVAKPAQEVEILEQTYNPDTQYGGGGGFLYTLKTSDGVDIFAWSLDDMIQGKYKYISPEGQEVVVEYVADKDGFRPKGAVLPTPPPIPEAILKSLEYIEKHATPAPQIK